MTRYLSIAETIGRLEALQSTAYVRERILKQFCPHLGQYTRPALSAETSQKGRSSSWAAYTMSHAWKLAREWISLHGDTYGLAQRKRKQLIPLSGSEICIQVQELQKRQPHFATSYLRSAASAVVDHFLEEAMLAIRAEHKESYVEYLKEVTRSGVYWFRRSPEEQLWTGMHTALSANFKMAQTCSAVLTENPNVTLATLEEVFAQAQSFISYVATSHLDVLQGVEGFVWDHAGTEPAKGFFASSNEGVVTLLVNEEVIAVVLKKMQKLNTSSSAESRIGCPAFMARSEQSSVLNEVQQWCESVIKRFYFPYVKSVRDRTQAFQEP